MISANGTATGSNHSGASGGSIWVDAKVLIGSGLFRADAAGKELSSNSNSAGGRVAVYYEDASDFEEFMDSSAASGGPGAEDGTIVFVDRTVPNLGLTVYGRLAFSDNSRQAFGRIRVDESGRFELGGGSFLLVADALELLGTSVMEVQSVNASEPDIGGYIGRGATIVANNLNLGADARITADGFGYPAGLGPGASPSNSIGASHGGAGGGASAPVYGDPDAPIELGSSGGVFGSLVRAGGAVRLTVPGEFMIDGSISANGIVVSGSNHSGATGGSIWIQAGTVSGDGVIEANASAKGIAGNNQGSGGGRIAIGTTNLFSLETGQLEVKGTDASAEDGTIRIQELDEITVTAWLSVPPEFAFGQVDVSWAVLDPGGDTISTLRLLSDQSETILGTFEDLAPSFPWDTTAIPDGDYTLMVTVTDTAGAPVGELAAEVFVVNEYEWHSGEITEDETWAADRLHVIFNHLAIGPGTTLTLEPGAVVKVFPGMQITVGSGGELLGTASEAFPITVTSFLDDEFEGDSNQDGSMTVPAAGDWRGIRVDVGGTLSTNERVSVLYAMFFPDLVINGSVVWPGDRLIWINEDVTVKSGGTLTIEPGAIIKLGRFKGIILEAGATLVAEGTAALPIIFTSERDDSHGGDTNEDGDATEPSAGDWRWIRVQSATANFDHVQILYGGGTGDVWSGTGVIRTSGDSEVLFENSIISDSFFDGILAWGGPVTIRNSIFRNIDRAVSAHPGSTVIVRNSTFDRNRIGLLLHGGTLDVANTIVANSFRVGLFRDFGEDNTTVSHCLFNNPRAVWGNIRGVSAEIGSQGNIEGDPMFLDGLNGEYRISVESAAIDAADTSKAPDTDLAGAPRFNEPSVPDTGVPGDGGIVADIGAYEYADGADSEIDLIVTAVSGPESATVGDTVEIRWTVKNIGSALVAGPWLDEIWLVANPGTSSEIARSVSIELVGSGLRLAPGESVAFKKDVVVPGSTTGRHLWKVRANAARTLFEGANATNNDRRSDSTTEIEVPILAIGEDSVEVAFFKAGDQFWYQFDSRYGAAILSVEAAGDDRALTEIYWAAGRLPSLTNFDGRQSEFGSDDVTSFAPQGIGTIYVLVRAAGLTESNVTVSVSANAVELGIAAIPTSTIGDRGTATLELVGAELGEHLQFELLAADGVTTYPAIEVYSTEPNIAYPTFAMDDVPRGIYRIRISDGTEVVDSESVVEVVETVDAELEVRMLGQTLVRRGRSSGLTVTYRNVGNVDLVAPLMKLFSSVFVAPPSFARAADVPVKPGEAMIAADEALFIEHFLGISGDGPAGILRPNSRLEEREFTFTAPPGQPAVVIDMNYLTSAGAGRPMAWDDFKDALRPPDFPDEGWDKVYELLKDEVGDTLGAVNLTAAQYATQLSRVGERERKFAPLIMQGLRVVDPSGWMGNRGRDHAAFGTTVPDLTENRVYKVKGGRYVVRLWGTPYHFEASEDEGRWVPSIRDNSMLLEIDDHFELHGLNGSNMVFSAGGNIDYIVDESSERLDFEFSSDRLQRVQYGDLVMIEFTYDSSGRVDSY